MVAPSGSEGTVCSWDKLPGGIRDMESGLCIQAVRADVDCKMMRIGLHLDIGIGDHWGVGFHHALSEQLQ